MKSSHRIIGMITAVLSLLLGMYLWKHYSPRMVERDVGYQGLAKINRYLGAQRYLESVGREVKTVARIQMNAMDKEGGQLILAPVDSLPQRDPELQKLRRWLSEGGTLATGFSSTTPTQEKWPVEFSELMSWASIGDVLRSRASDNLLVHLPQPWGATRVYNHSILDIDVESDIHHTAYIRFGDHKKDSSEKAHLWFYKKKVGQGQIIFFVDLSVFENEHIAKEQHASVLEGLQQTQSSGSIALCFRPRSSGLFLALWEAIPLTILFFTLLLLLYYYRASFRFGPRQKPLGESRPKSIRHHLEAAAQCMETSPRASISAEPEPEGSKSLPKKSTKVTTKQASSIP